MWKLEKGERIGVLDLLAGSSSLTSTVISQVQLGMLSFLSVGLVLIWALSPVGGQASFRQITTGNRTYNSMASFRYYQHIGDNNIYENSERASKLALPNALFMASLYATNETRKATADTWGNVKIPLIEDYEGSSRPDDGGWFDTHDAKTYSSLVGVPISTLQGPVTTYSLRIESEYLYLDCPSVIQDYEFQDKAKGYLGGYGARIYSNYTTRQFLTVNRTDNAVEPRTFVYGDWLDNAGLNAAINCTMTTTYIEADVMCDGSAICGVSRLRRSQLDHLPVAYTLFDVKDWGRGWSNFAQAFLQSIPGHPAFPTAVTYYLRNPGLVSSMAYGGEFTSLNQGNTTREEFATRLTQLFNTYWTCVDARNRLSMASPSLFVNDTSGGRVNGTQSRDVMVIVAHTEWVVVLVVASTVMVVASLAHPIISHFFIHTGDSLLLNFSSLAARDNPYMSAIPATGSFMTAGERAKLLKDFRIKLGDVKHEDEVGRLAIASLDRDKGLNVVDSKEGRLYE